MLPAVGQSGGILNDDDREELAQRGIRLAPSGMEQMGIELQNLYAALVQPREGLVATWPLAQGFAGSYIDAQTGATPLAMLKEAVTSGQSVTDLLSAESFIGYKNMLIGNMGGSLGEVAALALLIGFAYMLFRKIITWHIPVSIFVTVIVFSGILNLCNPSLYAGPVFHLLSGGLMLGAIFMATDYVTSPMSNKGMIIYGIGIGLLTVVIRVFGAYPEGMSFAILIMNAFTPLINRYCKPVRFA